ncbi:AraC family transcriptional regulator [Pontiella sulfatireligans]|nr:AraC family transcriptional regulator [Pontiella sulfatireligans]
MQQRSETEVSKLLKQAGLKFSDFSDIPLPDIRRAQRGAFPDMRMAHLASALRDEFLQKPITGDLLCTRVGFQGASPAHYIPRPIGSYDYILIYCDDGQGWLELDGNEWTVEKHSAFLVPAHVPHKYGANPGQPWSNHWVHFQGKQAAEFCELVFPSTGSPVIHLPQHQEMAACIEQLYQFMSKVHTYSTLVAATGALSQLLGVIQLRMRSSEQRSRTADENIDKTVEFMHRNLARKLPLKELANIAGMSLNHYGVLFSKRYYSTPIDYFNRLKIQRACELLTTTGMRISEVGEQLGFPDPYYFSRIFKKIMGISPRDYR